MSPGYSKQIIVRSERLVFGNFRHPFAKNFDHSFGTLGRKKSQKVESVSTRVNYTLEDYRIGKL